MQPLVVQPAKMTVSTPSNRKSRSRLVPKKALAYFFVSTFSPANGLIRASTSIIGEPYCRIASDGTFFANTPASCMSSA